MSHVRRTRALCETHKNLCSAFCLKCEEIFAHELSVKPGNHNIMTVKERASEVRAKVSELIAELDFFWRS